MCRSVCHGQVNLEMFPKLPSATTTTATMGVHCLLDQTHAVGCPLCMVLRQVSPRFWLGQGSYPYQGCAKGACSSVGSACVLRCGACAEHGCSRGEVAAGRQSKRTAREAWMRNSWATLSGWFLRSCPFLVAVRPPVHGEHAVLPRLPRFCTCVAPTPTRCVRRRIAECSQAAIGGSQKSSITHLAAVLNIEYCTGFAGQFSQARWVRHDIQ